MAQKKNSQKAKNSEDGLKLICKNRRAFFEYEIHERLECGIVLTGTEVKSLREGQSSLEDAYAKLDKGEVWLYNSDIPEYSKGNKLNHKPKRARKLLLNRREIDRFAGRATEKGFTLVPVRMYFKNGLAKVELAIGRGKQLHDKRESKKKAEAQREIKREMRARRQL